MPFPARRFSLWAGLAAAAGAIGGLFSLASRSGRRHRLLRQWTGQWRAVAQPNPAARASPSRFPLLRETIVGMSKSDVAETLGPPPAASMDPTAPAAAVQTHLEADVWYYPVDLRRHIAVAITFADGRAARVDYLTGPGVEQ